METKKDDLIGKFKDEWRCMWRNRLDDKLRAEGIADKDYSLLSVDRGTVIMATRKFRLLDFHELLQHYKLAEGGAMIPSDPSTGGWGKFIRGTLTAKKRVGHRENVSTKLDKNPRQQLKKCGRGWLHFKG